MEEEEENERKRWEVGGFIGRAEPEGTAVFNAVLRQATVSDDMIMASIEELPICANTEDDAKMKMLR